MMSIVVLLKRRLHSSIPHHCRAIKISVLLIFIVVFSEAIRGSYLILGSPPKCENSEEDIDNLVQITYKVHAILDSMGIDCWLMYGSLWGPLRDIQGPLPWDDDVDLAIDGDGRFSQMTFEEFKALFVVLGLSVENRLWQSSLIVISENDRWPPLHLFVFYNYNGMMSRAGIASWLMPVNFKLYHTFPSHLVEQPLPKVKFGYFNISVPRNGIEIMKYLYPYDWWKVVKPFGCVKTMDILKEIN